MTGRAMDPISIMALGLLFNLPSPVAGAPQVSTKQAGLVLEEVNAAGALAKAGLESGDVLVSWRAAGPGSAKQQGDLDSPFDWHGLVIEMAPRGAVELRGERAGAPEVFQVLPGIWDEEVRPRLTGAALAAYLEGRKRIAGGDLEAGIESWRQIASMVESGEVSWILFRIGKAWADARRWPEANAAYGEALVQASEPRARVTSHEAAGLAFRSQHRWDEAREAFLAALKPLETIPGTELSAARMHHQLALLARRQGDLDESETRLRTAMAIRERLAPRSIPTARSWNSLAVVARIRGDLEKAWEYGRRAVAILEELAPESVDMANTLNNLGNTSGMQGDLASAEDFYQRTLRLDQRENPESIQIAHSLNNLGIVALYRGDLDAADGIYERALDLYMKLSPDSPEMANTLGNLGVVAFRRGELDAAEQFFDRALAIYERLTPGSLDSAYSLHELGLVASERGDLEAAERLYRRAMAVREAKAPGSLPLASSYDELGLIALERKDVDSAEDYFRRGLAIYEEKAPESFQTGISFRQLGQVAIERTEIERAEGHFRRSLTIFERLAPDSMDEAEALHGLATVFRRSDRVVLAADTLSRALDALEQQVGKLGGSYHAKGGFRARFQHYYRQAIEVHLELERPRQAFHILERSRTRTLLAMLAERDLVFSLDLPEGLERDRKLLSARYDQVQQELASSNASTEQERIEELQRKLILIRRERQEILDQVREASPQLSALRSPRPLAFEDVREALDPGTVMLSYSVGEAATDLFVVTAQGALEVHALPIGGEGLRSEVSSLRDLIQRSVWPRHMADFDAASSDLYSTLVGPAAEAIERGERVLVVPDGPLHLLPFGALRRPASPGLEKRYLVEWRPLHSVQSATLWAELEQTRRAEPSEGRMMLAAFGDPSYPDQAGPEVAGATDVRVRSATRRGLLDWDRLPNSRREVERIAGLFPDEAARVFLGSDATEERAKSVARVPRILHFAAHGYLDDRFPLDSALALAIPRELEEGRDNGLLQAWEIFESMRVDADLVVLSACESALGAEQGGEGLIGLTRAFQHAGARTVVASLWSVEDRTTSELMVRFYGHLRAGMSKSEALRAAQRELIREPIQIETDSGQTQEKDASAPFYWAAFQVIGDWR